jgi:two-component system, response regulator PdtaR
MPEKSNILIVEDSEPVAILMASLLQENNYNVTDIVDTGEEAITKVKKYSPDLILMDIELNGKIDGIETAKMINSTVELPIIFVTGSKDTKNLERIKEVAPFAYLTKPFKTNDLLYTI